AEDGIRYDLVTGVQTCVLPISDPNLARAAEEALQKIEAVLPPRLKEKLETAALYAPGFHVKAQMRSGLEDLRRAVREQRKARFQIGRASGRATAQTRESPGVRE